MLRRAKKILSTEGVYRLGKEIFRTRNRSVGRTAQRLHRIARRKGEGARKDLKKAYWKLISITQASCAQATEVVEALRDHTVGAAEGLLEGFQRFVPLVERGSIRPLAAFLKESTFRPRRSS